MAVCAYESTYTVRRDEVGHKVENRHTSCQIEVVHSIVDIVGFGWDICCIEKVQHRINDEIAKTAVQTIGSSIVI
jgi:hypothetical protein